MDLFDSEGAYKATIFPKLTSPHPLEGKYYIFYLLIWQTQIRLHHLGVQIILSEIREKFWILGASQAIKKGATQASSLEDG